MILDITLINMFALYLSCIELWTLATGEGSTSESLTVKVIFGAMFIGLIKDIAYSLEYGADGILHSDDGKEVRR